MEKKQIPMCEKVYSERTEKEIEFEESLPEYCPNIEKIIKISAVPYLSEKSFDDDKIYIDGTVTFRLIYMSDYKNKVKCISFSTNFSKEFPIKNLSEYDDENIHLMCDLQLMNINALLANARKLQLKAKLIISLDGISCGFAPLYSKDSDEIETLDKTITSCQTHFLPKNSFNITDEITLENDMPSINDIIYSDSFVYCDNIQKQDEKATIMANIIYNCIYEAENEMGNTEYISFQKKIPFSGEIEFSDIDMPYEIICIPEIESANAESQVNAYGESKMISLSFVVTAEPTLYKNNEYTIFEDAFSPDYESEVRVQPFMTESISHSISEKCDINEKVKVDLKNLSNIMQSTAVTYISNVEEIDGKLILNGKANLSIIGNNQDGDISSFETSFPIHAMLNNSNFQKDMKFSANSDLESVYCIIENGELNVRMTLCVKCIAFEKVNVNALYDFKVLELVPKECRNNILTVCYPENTDTIWAIAKSYGVSPEKIKNANKKENKKTIIIPCK